MVELSWNTSTMAELYFKQGDSRRAVAIYRHIVREKPDDKKSWQRLQELEHGISEKSVDETRGHAMSFREQMQDVVKAIPGAIACSIMGYDGIAVDTYQVGGEIDIPNLMIEYSVLTKQLRENAQQKADGGDLQELIIHSANLVAMMRVISSEYFLALVLSPNAVLGKARYLMRVRAPKLAKDLV